MAGIHWKHWGLLIWFGLLASSPPVSAQQIHIGVIVDFPENDTIAECFSVPEYSNGHWVLNHTPGIWGVAGEWHTQWGFYLERINDVGPLHPGDFRYWSFLVDMHEDPVGWNVSPVGLDNNNSCWNRSFGYIPGQHYCAQEGDILGFSFGEPYPNKTYAMLISAQDDSCELVEWQPMTTSTSTTTSSTTSTTSSSTTSSSTTTSSTTTLPPTSTTSSTSSTSTTTTTSLPTTSTSSTTTSTTSTSTTSTLPEANISAAGDAAIAWLLTHQNQSTGEVEGNYVWDTCFATLAFIHYEQYEAALLSADYVLSQQNPDGGWGWGTWTDPETTATCLSAMHAIGVPESEMTKSGNTPQSYLASTQGPNGGFSSWGAENIQSSAWGITGLTGANESLPSQNNNTPVDYLTETQQPTGQWTYFDPVYDTAISVIALTADPHREHDANISAALAYLKDNQAANGSMGTQFNTALAALAFTTGNETNATNHALTHIAVTHQNGGCAGSGAPVASATALCAMALGGHCLTAPPTLPPDYAYVVLEPAAVALQPGWNLISFAHT